MTRPKPLRKRVSCRTKTAIPVDTLWANLKDISYVSGPFITGKRGPWGEVQIWAETHQVGESVASSILLAAGWTPADIEQGETWHAVARSRGERRETMRPAIDQSSIPRLSMRDGPAGQPIRPNPVAH